MKTAHHILFADARDMRGVADESIELIVTSPPYPMIQMWDETFCTLSSAAAEALARGDGPSAFERMHRELDRVWRECFRVLKPGCLVCINVGDATRTLDGVFQLYSNHARILTAMCRIGFVPLPDILWRKQTNAPNKFMGAGMLPAGAYVTYEHEYVLIFRKGDKRRFRLAEERLNRRRSAFFWEERNVWFSDVWTDLKGTEQDLSDGHTRARSGAYPFELAYRLVKMFSVYGDTVLDPFLGTGTTTVAAMVSGRNSIGIEIDQGLRETIQRAVRMSVSVGNEQIDTRLSSHWAFVETRMQAHRPLKHQNRHYGFPVMTSQETDLLLYRPVRMSDQEADRYEVEYAEQPASKDHSCRPSCFMNRDG